MIIEDRKIIWNITGPDKNMWSFFVYVLISQPKTYDVGTQKVRLNETALLSTQKQVSKPLDKQILTISVMSGRVF